MCEFTYKYELNLDDPIDLEEYKRAEIASKRKNAMTRLAAMRDEYPELKLKIRLREYKGNE